MYAEPKDSIRNIPFESIWLSLFYSPISPLIGAHFAIDLISKKVIEESIEEGHDDTFTVAPNRDVDVEGAESVGHRHKKAHFSIFLCCFIFSILKQFAKIITRNNIEKSD